MLYVRPRCFRTPPSHLSRLLSLSCLGRQDWLVWKACKAAVEVGVRPPHPRRERARHGCGRCEVRVTYHAGDLWQDEGCGVGGVDTSVREKADGYVVEQAVDASRRRPPVLGTQTD